MSRLYNKGAIEQARTFLQRTRANIPHYQFTQWRIEWSIDWSISWLIDWLTFFGLRSVNFLCFAHIFGLVNLGFTMPINYIQLKNCDKITYKQHWWVTICFVAEGFFRRKLLIFLFWCVNRIGDLNSHFWCSGAVGQSVGPASGRLGVQIPAATDLSRKNR